MNGEMEECNVLRGRIQSSHILVPVPGPQGEPGPQGPQGEPGAAFQELSPLDSFISDMSTGSNYGQWSQITVWWNPVTYQMILRGEHTASFSYDFYVDNYIRISLYDLFPGQLFQAVSGSCTAHLSGSGSSCSGGYGLIFTASSGENIEFTLEPCVWWQESMTMAPGVVYFQLQFVPAEELYG